MDQPCSLPFLYVQKAVWRYFLEWSFPPCSCQRILGLPDSKPFHKAMAVAGIMGEPVGVVLQPHFLCILLPLVWTSGWQGITHLDSVKYSKHIDPQFLNFSRPGFLIRYHYPRSQPPFEKWWFLLDDDKPYYKNGGSLTN